MTRGTAWFLHISTFLVGGTGLVYAWMRYFATPADEFAIVNHPLQPDVLHLHVLTAPALVFGCGLIWHAHIWSRFRSGFRSRRKSGLALLATLLPMIASGYLLQISEQEFWRELWIVVHVATSLIWLLFYVTHELLVRNKKA